MVAEAEGSMTQLQRLVLDFRNDEEIVVRCLYRSSLDGPNPTTKARTREVTELAKSGLRDALDALEVRVDVVGSSGFTTREDVLLVTTSSDALETVGQVKGG
jgi:hypothetical protein